MRRKPYAQKLIDMTSGTPKLPLLSPRFWLLLSAAWLGPGLLHALPLQAASGDGQRAEQIAELEDAVAAAVDERGVPTPEQFALRVELARLYLDTDRTDDAMAHLRVAAELGQLEEDLSYLLAEQEMRDGRVAAARRQYRLLSERYGSSRAELRLADLALERGRDKQALAHARRAVEHADDADFVEDTEETAADLERALDVLWTTASRVGAYGEALSALQRLAELSPRDFRYPWHVGGILVRQGKNAEAVEALTRAHELMKEAGDHGSATNRELGRDLGLALVAEDRFEEARVHLESYLETSPDGPGFQVDPRADDQADSRADVLAALAQVEERLGDTGQAEERARRVLDAIPDHAGALLVMGRLHAGSGDFESARRALEAAVASDPDSGKVHYQLSLACARLRDRDCAERHLARYQELRDAPEDVVEMKPRKTGGTEDDGGR